MIQPYYQDEYTTIYKGDCRFILPQLSMCDLILTDPPYGINENAKKQSSRSVLVAQRNYGAYDWDKTPPAEWLFGLMREKSRHQIIWGGNFFPLPPSSCWLVWDKDNGENDFADCELAWTNLPKAVRRFKWKWQGMLQENMARKEHRSHPTQKPLALIKWCLGLIPEAKTIIDPFMGSGTTLVAAKALGLQAIGIELDERYCEIATERLRQAPLPLQEAI